MGHIAAMVSSLVPPKIASPNAIGGAADANRMKRVVGFYEKLPRGPAPTPGQGLPAVVSAQVHERQEPKRCPSVPPDRWPSGYELRQPVLLPSASPQEQRSLS